jgi:hypothetical protein
MDIVHPIPYQLSSLGIGGSGQYALQDYIYDYAIAGIPFLSAISDERPFTNRMAEIRKEQFDNFAEPGEQSLQGWWLRSQSTFNGGAGILYQDPDTDNQFNYRFADSLGIDPWTSGQLKLLRNTAVASATALTPNFVQGFVDSTGVDAFWHIAGNTLLKVTDAATTTVVGVSVSPYFDLTSTGYTYAFARGDGIWTGVDAAAPTQRYNTAITNGVLEFVKDRLILGSGPSVYQLPPFAAVAPLPTADYTHVDPNWRWRSITDGPTAIYIAGDSGTTSQIHRFTVVNGTTGVPEFEWAGVTATMPTGERINEIYSYIGSFIGIATNKGFRVGEIDSNGDITYGPLLFEPEGGCNGIVGQDRFMWTGSTNAHDGFSGLYRVDLGNVIQEQTSRAVRYAYARDIYLNGDAGEILELTNFGASDRKVFSVTGEGAVLEDATELLPNGYLETGRIRFNTEEPKLYKFFSIRTPSPLEGNLNITILTEGGGEIPSITYGPTTGAGVKDVGISNPQGPQNWLALRFTLFRGEVDPTIGAVMNGWQVKTLPGSIRQRIITLPVLMLDEETDKGGQLIGYDGYTQDRLNMFEAVARAGDVVLYQDLQQQLVTQVVIDDFEFRQTGPPGIRGPVGGFLTVVMRTVAEST